MGTATVYQISEFACRVTTSPRFQPGHLDDDDDEFHNSENYIYTRAFKPLARAGIRILNEAVTLNPISNAGTAISGTNAEGKKVSNSERGWAVFNLACSFFGKIGGKIGHVFSEEGIGGRIVGGVVKFIRGSPCFVAGTPVQVLAAEETSASLANKDLSPSGMTPSLLGLPVTTKPIEQVQASDKVATRNPETGQTEFKRVVATKVSSTQTLLIVALADKATGQVVERLTTTPQHPFYVADKGFTSAVNLAIGNAIVTRAGPALIVQSVMSEAHPEGVQVFNFEVEDDHSYFVGTANGGIWVHNDCIPELLSWRQALKSVTSGDVRVATRADAEEIARAFAGYKNTTGEIRREAELLSRLNQNPGYYHWADNVVVEDGIARVAGHAANDVHGLYRHLQIHTFGGKTVRVFYGSPVR